MFYNTNTLSVRSEFPNFDKILSELKITPQALSIPVPRYLLEDNQEERDKRNQMIRKLMMTYHETVAPEEEVFVDRATFFENKIEHAICCI